MDDQSRFLEFSFDIDLDHRIDVTKIFQGFQVSCHEVVPVGKPFLNDPLQKRRASSFRIA